jgi:hypothetical protein
LFAVLCWWWLELKVTAYRKGETALATYSAASAGYRQCERPRWNDVLIFGLTQQKNESNMKI